MENTIGRKLDVNNRRLNCCNWTMRNILVHRLFNGQRFKKINIKKDRSTPKVTVLFDT